MENQPDPKTEPWECQAGMKISCDFHGWTIHCRIVDGPEYQTTHAELSGAISELIKMVTEDAKKDEALEWAGEVAKLQNENGFLTTRLGCAENEADRLRILPAPTPPAPPSQYLEQLKRLGDSIVGFSIQFCDTRSAMLKEFQSAILASDKTENQTPPADAGTPTMATAIADKKTKKAKPTTAKPKPKCEGPKLPKKYRENTLSVRQAANELAVSDTTVLRAIKTGKLRALPVEAARPYFLIAAGDLAKFKVARLKASR